MTRPTREAWAMALAVETAKRATCLRRAVGCVLLSGRGHVLSTGYNGVASGQPHCNEATGKEINPALITGLKRWEQKNGDGSIDVLTQPIVRVCEHWERPEVEVYGHACPGARSPSGTNLDGCQAIHAEQNALLQCRDVYQVESCFSTTAPCLTCVKLLLNTGCRTIWYLEDYRQAGAARELWEGAGRDWGRMDAGRSR